ncbi:MAG: N-6 DNA methylase [Opitutaceae bacterium]
MRDTRVEPERFVPVVYVCDADDELAAQELHRLVWNQDVVPYIIVREPKGLKVYAGFHFSAKGKTDADRGVIQALTDFEQAQTIIGLFKATNVDTGKIWQDLRLQVDPSRRVYHQLLRGLRELDKWLRGSGGLKREVSHALIGKYVYLRYLRDRDILSNERLTGMWGIQESEIFSASATKAALDRLTGHLDEWLNGDIFPLRLHGEGAPTSDHVQRVAATFAGAEISGDSWQPHLDFKAYDFSYIPIETLSLIYEQFLHAEDPGQTQGAKSRGRKAGAYYTPLPLVNFMLSELQSRHPLQAGMRICDPSCGSGAFLVQAYRRLIELAIDVTKPAKPADLRSILETSIYGVDLDGDACQVTQLSLLLTLLDYVDPPDLSGRQSTFKLPSLANQNIFEANFFAIESRFRATLGKTGFDWIVGNPPWKQLKENDHDEGGDKAVWDWMTKHTATEPVGMYQMAQAFVWEAPRYLADDGECALLVPAMGLFEEPSEEFRKKFFHRFQVHTVANFANLAEVLFDGRARVPTAALFYRRRPGNEAPDASEPVTTISPFVVNQEATRPLVAGERGKLWSLVVNGSEVRTLELGEIISGRGMPWKLAMWGTPWDERLIRRLEQRWPSLDALEAKWHSGKEEFVITAAEQIFCVSEGLQLRFKSGDDVEPVTEVAGKKYLDVDVLAKLRDIFAFPAAALTTLNKKGDYYALTGRVKRPLTVSRAPHILVSAARNFAVYSEDFIVVPARQIGIVSRNEDRPMLKALALYLSSDFAYYHQFIRSTELGIKRDRATLEALRQLPIPIANLSRSDLKEWTDLHTKLVKCAPRSLHPEESERGQPLFDFVQEAKDDAGPLIEKLNKLVADVLGLDARERALVHDLVRVRLHLNDGKLGQEAVRPPTDTELHSYGCRLRQELDEFVGEDAKRFHAVTVIREADSAMVEVDLISDRAAARELKILRASSEAAVKLIKTRRQLLEERSQWVYFNRNLRVYRGHQTYLFKPLQRFQWTESAAMLDAGELIAETLGAVS